MNPFPIIAFIAVVGIVSSGLAFAWACMSRQFTGYDLGTLPLETDDAEIDEATGVDHKPGDPSRRLRAAILVGAMVMVFGLIGWTIYLVLALANGGSAG